MLWLHHLYFLLHIKLNLTIIRQAHLMSPYVMHTCQLSVFWRNSPAFSKYINSNVQLKLPKRVKSPSFFMLSVRINVLCPAKLVCFQPNLKLCPVFLLTEVGMYGHGKPKLEAFSMKSRKWLPSDLKFYFGTTLKDNISKIHRKK